MAVTSPSSSSATWSQGIPAASWSTLGADTTLTSANLTDDDAVSSVPSDASSRSIRHLRTSSETAPSVASVDSSLHSNLLPGYTKDTPPLHSAAAAVHSLDVPSLNQTDSELAAVLVTQVIWLADIVRTHVRNLPPDDLADEVGRRLMQARGQ